MLAFLRRVSRLRFVRRILRYRVVEHFAWIMLIGSLVRESITFVRRETIGGRRRVCYQLRESGLKIVIRHRTLDVPTLAEIFLERRYQPLEEVSRFLDGIDRPPEVVDLGANIGLFGAFFLTLYPDARLTAVEADPENAGVHREVIAENARGDSWALVEAVASTSGEQVPFLPGRNVFSRVAPSNEADATLLPAIDVLPVLARADLAKIDIEGGEWRIMADERFRWLPLKALVLEYHSQLCKQPDPRRAAVGTLRDAGYDVRALGETTSDYGTFGMVWAWKPEIAQRS